MADTPRFYSDEATIIAIGERFADLTLPKAEWTHAAHFAACLWVLARRPDLNAERGMPDMIRRYNEATGGVNSDSAGYHETITQASIRATGAHLSNCSPDLLLHQIHALLMTGPYGNRDWLFDYWSKDTLMGATARAVWVSPDRQPLPF